MAEFAVIGGTGLTSIDAVTISSERDVSTPFGEPSGKLLFGKLAGREIVFLPRHGRRYAIPPHKINYRANIRALKDCGCRKIISVNAVGGITGAMQPGRLVIPGQVIDYTHSRKNTYFEDDLDRAVNIDFTDPYSADLRNKIIAAGATLDLDLVTCGTMGVTQGPRLETIAEINRLERDGCDIVGMTGMPEACLARELELDYAAITVVANQAAGKGDAVITMQTIEKNLADGMTRVLRLIKGVIQ